MSSLLNEFNETRKHKQICLPVYVAQMLSQRSPQFEMRSTFTADKMSRICLTNNSNIKLSKYAHKVI